MTMRWPPLSPEGDVRAGGREAGPPLALTPTPPIAPGGVVAGKYRVDQVIGFGGMGIVCAATHLELGTPIAIKFVRPEQGSDERTVARFLTEARAAAQLQSQFACRVMDCGRLPSGSPYIVMEYLVGQDLRSQVGARGPLSVEETVALALSACEALAEAHSKRIVHRDVKPENLFIAQGPGGAPLLKVLDFGISKQLSPLASQRSFTDSTESMGSPFHMSPEQMIDPASVDSRTDIWSLGVVLYEVLTGQLPFAGETGPQLCANVMTTQPLPPQAHRAEIPEGLARVIVRCLEKDRERRYRDVGALALALKDFGGADAALAAARIERGAQRRSRIRRHEQRTSRPRCRIRRRGSLHSRRAATRLRQAAERRAGAARCNGPGRLRAAPRVRFRRPRARRAAEACAFDERDARARVTRAAPVAEHAAQGQELAVTKRRAPQRPSFERDARWISRNAPALV